MNRIDQPFLSKKNILNIYFTAGFPKLVDTIRIAMELERAGADMIEIGLPFSDPIADGPTIQGSSDAAISNGMTLNLLFGQLKELRTHVKIPVVLMGYLNPILQYGFQKFCADCKSTGIDGLILPDLPMYEYKSVYKTVMDEKGLYNIFLVTPQTSVERIMEIDEFTNGFIYLVSSLSITGAKSGISEKQIEYFSRIKRMNLKNKILIGFGISDNRTFAKACQYSDGSIIGSAFIKQLKHDASNRGIHEFVKNIKTPQP